MNDIDILIHKLCPDGVDYKPLGEICVILDNQRKPVTKSRRARGIYPYYGANGIQDYVDNYIFDGTYVLVGEDGSVITANGTPVVTWATGKIWVNNHAHIISEKEGVILRYLYHCLQTIDVTHLIHGNIPKLTGSDFKLLNIPVPPLEIQKEIANILDKFSLLEEELEEELEERRKQYEYYRSQLLTFGNFKTKANIPYKKLGDVTNVLRGSRLTKSQLINEGYPVYHGALEPLGYYDKYNRDGNDVIVVNTGSIGEVGYSKDPFWCSDGCFTIEKCKDLDSKFLYHYLSQYKHYLVSKIRVGGVPTIDKKTIEDIEIPVPPLDIQKRIVNILDNFEKICTDLNIGLPAEIEARQKQYEYYRDKLLKFTPVVDERERERA